MKKIIDIASQAIRRSFDILVAVMIAFLFAMWMARIALLLYHGMMHEAFSDIVMLALVILCYTTTQRMERMGKINAMLAEHLQQLRDTEIFIDHLRELIAKNEAESQQAGDSQESETTEKKNQEGKE